MHDQHKNTVQRPLLLTFFTPSREAVDTLGSSSPSFGIGLVPNAIPTIAVMCVSGPNTYILSPSLMPVSLMARRPS